MPNDYTQKVIVPRSVHEDDRTPARDDCADRIKELWGLTLSEIGQQSGYSRQHVKNTLDDYYEVFESESDVPDEVQAESVIEPKDRDEISRFETPSGQFGIDIPADADAEAYLKGYSIGGDVDDLDSFVRGAMKRYMQREKATYE
jgi:hypothetical protein